MEGGMDPYRELSYRINEELGLPRETSPADDAFKSVPTRDAYAAILKVYSTNPDGSWVGGKEPSTAHMVVSGLRKKYGSRMDEETYSAIYGTCNAIIFAQNALSALPGIMYRASRGGPEGDRAKKAIAKMLDVKSTPE